MANVYTSDSFDIEEAYASSYYESGSPMASNHPNQEWFLLVQRKPTTQYPAKTEVIIKANDMAVDVSESQFLSTAPGLVTSKLAEYDGQAAFSGSALADSYKASSDFTQKFNS